MKNLSNGLAVGFALTYPLAVYVGLQHFEPRIFGALLGALLLLRRWQSVRSCAARLKSSERLSAALVGAYTLTIVASNNELLLLLYPVVVSLALLSVFGRSLLNPPTVIERIARLSEPDLPPWGVLHTRRVTQVWCAFFVFNAAVSLATTFASREVWLLYNGFVAYLLMGVLFACEWLVRVRVRRRAA
ncbi:hypothetical protein [Accumulibacter sp.]|uniref:COG4648 family protein n=1 Tax=Accumulibacter sp. TaxID=2053492 RepID=UPI0025F7DAD1|nr:hypothetical protein [Accumulibacter sp.]MCM8614092.1 hypothetical protein [Accumulibacter sp.]MCM8637884.1 hypothetical protein [Accumulibacter sp.]MCM8641291.1 hypothetical protein [Accumulibacter sp.]